MKSTFTLKLVLILLFVSSVCVKASAQQSLAFKKTGLQDTSAQQNNVRAESIYAEFAGPGLAFTANYDTRFSNRRDGWGGRIGAGYFAEGGNILISAPLQINYLIGKKNKFLELGIGGTFIHTKGDADDAILTFDKITGVVGTATVAYRYQPENSGFTFRAEVSPFISNMMFIPVPGVSLGYTFK